MNNFAITQNQNTVGVPLINWHVTLSSSFRCREKTQIKIWHYRVVQMAASRAWKCESKANSELMRFWKVCELREANKIFSQFVFIIELRSAVAAQWKMKQAKEQTCRRRTLKRRADQVLSNAISLSPLTNNKWSAIYHPGAIEDALASHIKLFSFLSISIAKRSSV